MSSFLYEPCKIRCHDLIHRESLIRLAFQSLQLVVTDFLPIIPSSCLQISVEVAAKFGLQNQELNISLTAIGLLVIQGFCFHCLIVLKKGEKCLHYVINKIVFTLIFVIPILSLDWRKCYYLYFV